MLHQLDEAVDSQRHCTQFLYAAATSFDKAGERSHLPRELLNFTDNLVLLHCGQLLAHKIARASFRPNANGR